MMAQARGIGEEQLAAIDIHDHEFVLRCTIDPAAAYAQRDYVV
jgi:hypothetical protein